MVYTFTVAPARGPGDERKRSGAPGRTASGQRIDTQQERERERERIDTQWATGTGGEEATTDNQQLSRGTRHPTLATTRE